MAGEENVLEVAFDNTGLVAFAPNTVAVIDTSTADTTPFNTAAKTATTSTGQVPIGVIYDRSRTDNTGAVVSAGMDVRVMGIARIIADAAITAGSYVTWSSSTAGWVHTATASTTATKAGVLGLALNVASANGDQVMVLLTPGVLI